MNLYITNDANGQPQRYAHGTVVTYAQRIDTLDELAMAAVAHPGVQLGDFTPVEIQHAYGDLEGLADELLARWAITREVQPDTPVRAEIVKTTVMDRLVALGKAAQVQALFTGSVQGFVYAQKWNAPGWPNVYKDDPDLLAAFQAMGLTPAEIAQVLA